jgi:hypothetical protein
LVQSSTVAPDVSPSSIRISFLRTLSALPSSGARIAALDVGGALRAQ